MLTHGIRSEPILAVTRAFLLLLCLVALAPAARAGSIPLTWDPVSDEDLDGYKVYYGTAPGIYSDWEDVGNTTTHTLTGLDDCTRYYIAVKAYDTSGNESEAYSNELAGLPTPVVSSISPVQGERGQSLTVTVTGTSFGEGADVEFSGPGITVHSTTYLSCYQLEASISIAANATLSLRDVDAVNQDQSYGRLPDAFEVLPVTPPIVVETDPVDGATEVSVSVHPTVTFSEPMEETSITPQTVRLLDPTGAAVPQAAGSPSLDAARAVATIVPLDDLQHETTYRIEVIGGDSGVLDSLGTPMESTYLQDPGFTTAAVPDAEAPTVTSTDPADGATGVAAQVQPTVTFSEPLDPATVTTTTIRLLRPDGTAVPQAAGSPTLDAAGTVATITPLEDLDEKTYFRIQVRGGATGVKDLAGNPMTADYLQDPGFETVGTPPGQVGNLRRTDTK
jgi:hypothetical protein